MRKIILEKRKTILVSCSIKEVEAFLFNNGIETQKEFEKSFHGHIYLVEKNPLLPFDVMWINPRGFCDTMEILDTLAHELRHAKYPSKTEEEILNSDEFPLIGESYPKVLQDLFEEYVK